ncbi:MAG: hypothetical protein OXB86_02730 [Bdellovibrionales bacterium]|nr:hypothetical protein [Bdellovibrionales bacterium]
MLKLIFFFLSAGHAVTYEEAYKTAGFKKCVCCPLLFVPEEEPFLHNFCSQKCKKKYQRQRDKLNNLKNEKEKEILDYLTGLVLN